MEQGRSFLDVLGSELVGFAPRLAAAVLIAALGWLAALLLKHLTARAIDLFETIYRRYAPVGDDSRPMWRPAVVQSISRIVFWVIFIAALVVAVSVLGIDALGGWVDDFLAYLPTLAVGIIIVLAGFVLGALARELVSHAAAAAGFRGNETLGRVAQVALIACAALVGASQIGIDVSLLANLAIVFIATLLGAFALSFGLATPPHVSNIISARYLQRRYQPGDHVRIGEQAGRILEITSRSVVLETDEGELVIPARRFADEPVLKLAPEESDEQQ